MMFIFKEKIFEALPASMSKALKDNYRTLRGWINKMRYKGDNVYCPCCDQSFSVFKHYVYSPKINNESRFIDTYKHTVCPNCYANPRHRIVCYYLNQHKDYIFKNNYSVLMIGAEGSIMKWFKRNNVNYTTTDLFDKTADVISDIQNMPFSDNSWSLIICNHVLEHIPNLELALKELKRVLNKDGILEISVPTDKTYSHTIENTGTLPEAERVKVFGQIDHFRIFGNDVETILSNTGFTIETINGDSLPLNIRAVIGPANYDDNRIFLCRK